MLSSDLSCLAQGLAHLVREHGELTFDGVRAASLIEALADCAERAAWLEAMVAPRDAGALPAGVADFTAERARRQRVDLVLGTAGPGGAA